MNPSELGQMINDQSEERLGLLAAKGQDYAAEDALANFKRMQELCFILGIEPMLSAWDCAMFLALLKVDRWCNLRRKESKPKNESIKDTLFDLHNYFDLAFACQSEEWVPRATPADTRKLFGTEL